MNTTYFLNQIMGNVFKTKTTPALPSKCFIGLSSTAPEADGTGATEPESIGTGYERVELSSLSHPQNGVITNTAALTFPDSLTNWGIMKYYVIYDAKTGGNLLMYGLLSIERVIEMNTIVTIKSGSLTLVLSDPE